MAPSDRPGPALTERVLRDSRRFSFFQLVRLLQLAHPDAPPPGGAGPPQREPIRFRARASLGFAASDVDAVETRVPPDGGPPRYDVVVNFMGLYGPASPLPTHYTEDILWAGSDEDGAKDFIDLFNHRLISFVYRSWEKYRHAVQFDPVRVDEYTKRALCLIGVGTDGMDQGVGLPLVPLLAGAGLLAARQRSAAGLEGLLRVHLGEIGVRVVPCVEHWQPIPAAQRMQLGRRGSRLGHDAGIGERMLDRSGAFRIVLGPLTGDQFRSFLPRGDGFGRLVALVRLYVADPLDFHVVLRLRAKEIPPLRLAPDADMPLGQMSWVAPTGAEEGRATILIRHHDPLVRKRPKRETAPPPSRAAAPAPSRVQSRPTPVTTTRRG